MPPRGSSLAIPLALVGLLVVATAACAPLTGYPNDPGDTDAELAALQVYFAGDIRTKYDAILDPGAKQQFRDAVVYGRLRAYDIMFKRFEKALSGESNVFNIGTDWIVLGLNAAGAVTGASAVLSAASAGIVGARGAVDKDLFYRKTLPAILAEMEARRADARVPIEQGLRKPDAQYSLHEALANLSAYETAGTIPGAITGIVNDAGAKGSAAEMAITIARSPEFVKGLPSALQIQSRLKALTPDQALAVAMFMEPNLATRSERVRTLVSRMDPGRARLRSGDAAKAFLPQWQINDDRDAASIKQWADALDAVQHQ